MTSQQIYTQLYQFLGGRTCRGGFKTRAIKSVKIFRDNLLDTIQRNQKHIF